MARITRMAHTVARVAHTRGSRGWHGSLAYLADPNLYGEKRPAEMKTMSEKAGLGLNFKNHSSRKTMIQTLVNKDVAPMGIMQLMRQQNLKVSLELLYHRKKTAEHFSHGTEFGRNVFSVWLFFCGEKKAKV